MSTYYQVALLSGEGKAGELLSLTTDVLDAVGDRFGFVFNWIELMRGEVVEATDLGDLDADFGDDEEDESEDSESEDFGSEEEIPGGDSSDGEVIPDEVNPEEFPLIKGEDLVNELSALGAAGTLLRQLGLDKACEEFEAIVQKVASTGSEGLGKAVIRELEQQGVK